MNQIAWKWQWLSLVTFFRNLLHWHDRTVALNPSRKPIVMIELIQVNRQKKIHSARHAVDGQFTFRLSLCILVNFTLLFRWFRWLSWVVLWVGCLLKCMWSHVVVAGVYSFGCPPRTLTSRLSRVPRSRGVSHRLGRKMSYSPGTALLRSNSWHEVWSK